MVRHKVSPERRTFAKSQRRAQTIIEEIVWRELRARRFNGLKFKRQVPIGPFIADFVCFEARLIVEVDGPQHKSPTRKERDRRRDRWFSDEGFAVFRITGEEVLGGLDIAMARLKGILEKPSTIAPSSGLTS
jgi:type I restriction enzyme R subunit